MLHTQSQLNNWQLFLIGMLFICLIYRFWNPPWGPNPVELEYKYTKKSNLTQGKEISKFQWILSKKVYWKILNYRLCRILRNALTHVPCKFIDQECLMSISSRYYHLWRRNQMIRSGEIFVRWIPARQPTLFSQISNLVRRAGVQAVSADRQLICNFWTNLTQTENLCNQIQEKYEPWRYLNLK